MFRLHASLQAILSALLLFAGCATSTPKKEVFALLPQAVWERAKPNLYEVVMPVGNASTLLFDRDPDVDMRSVRDGYVGIGTAVRVRGNCFISAAHLFQLEAPGKPGALRLRDATGALLTPSRVTRYSTEKDVIEFQASIAAAPPAAASAWADGKPSGTGQIAFALGDVLGTGPSFRAAQVSDLTENMAFYSDIRPSAAGGALVDPQGGLLGIITGRDLKTGVNVALSMKNLRLLKANRAAFRWPDVRFAALPVAIRKKWEFDATLPLGIEELHSIAAASLQKFLSATEKEIDSRSSGFPRNLKFRAYLRQQNFGAIMGLLKTDPRGETWRIETAYSIAQRRDFYSVLVDYLGQGFLPALVEIKNADSLKEAFEHPERLLDKIISSGHLSPLIELAWANQSHLIGAGAPNFVETFLDPFGRVWTSAAWSTRMAETEVLLMCSPVLQGAGCLVALGPRGQMEILKDHGMKRAASRVILTYGGSPEQWRRFYREIPKASMPPLLRDARIDFSAGKPLRAKMGGLSIDLKASNTSENAELWAYMGYSPLVPLGLGLLRLQYLPDRMHRPEKIFALHNFYEPPTDSDAGVRADWDALRSDRSPYDGNPFTSSAQWREFAVIGREALSLQGARVVRAGLSLCFDAQNTTREDFHEECRAFVKGLGFDEAAH